MGNAKQSGEAQWELEISNSGEALAEEIDVFTNLLADVQRLRLRPAPSQSYYVKTGPTQFIAPLKNAVVRIWIGPEVLAVNELRVEFVVAPLRGQFSVAAGGQDTLTTSLAGGDLILTVSGGLARSPCNPGGGLVLATEYSTQIGLSPHAHIVNVPAHTHEVVFPAHQHLVMLPTHIHTVNVQAHTHALEWGVIEDTASISQLSCWLNGVQVAQLINAETKQPMRPSVSRHGAYEADLLPILEAFDYRSRMHILEFRLMGGRAQIWAQVVGRVTIQPIAV